MVAYRLKGGASAWWDQVQNNRRRQGKGVVKTWGKTKKLLKGRFLPLDYEKYLFQQFQNCMQGVRFVAKYTAEFLRLAACCDLSETDVQQTVQYINGLKFPIRRRQVYSLFGQQRRLEISRQVTSELPRNNFEKEKQPIRVPIRSSVVGKQGNEGSNSVLPRQTSGVHNRDVTKNPYNTPTSNKCYRCGKPGHNSSVCQARKPVHFVDREDNCVGDIEEGQGNDDLLMLKLQKKVLGSKTLGLNVLELHFVMLVNHDQNVQSCFRLAQGMFMCKVGIECTIGFTV